MLELLNKMDRINIDTSSFSDFILYEKFEDKLKSNVFFRRISLPLNVTVGVVKKITLIAFAPLKLAFNLISAPFGLSVMNIKSSDPSAAAVRSLLKLHRDEEPLRNVIEVPFAYFSEEEVISTSPKEENRKMRVLYHELFGIAKNVAEIKQAVEEFFQNVNCSAPQMQSTFKRMLRGFYAAWKASDAYNELTVKLGIKVLLNIEPTQEILKCVKEVLKNTNAKTLNEFYEATKNSSIWNKVESLGLTPEQEASSVLMLLGVTDDNIGRGLMRLTLDCMRNPQILTDIKNELLKSEAGEPSAARDLIRRTINESLRHSPVLPSIFRKTSQALNLSDFGGPNQIVPANTHITIDLKSFATDPKIVGENPETFCPYRKTAIKDRSLANGFLPSYPSMPFGSGANQCPAWKWYSIVAEAVLEKLARQYG